MAFVKLDCGILNSSIWTDFEVKFLFITGLLMAEPREITDPLREIKIRSLERSDFHVPPGWYGFVPAAGSGIIRQCGLDMERGLHALERLAAPDPESRTPDFEGRRMVRVDGGFIILNYQKHRDRDHTATARSRRFRERRRETPLRNGETPVSPPFATQAEAEAEGYNNNTLAKVPCATIYAAYPRKVGKQEALKAIRRVLDKGITPEFLLERVAAYQRATAAWPAGERHFIPHPSTWFNRGSYEDDPETWQRKSDGFGGQQYETEKPFG